MANIDRVVGYGQLLGRVLKEDDALVVMIGVDQGFPLDALDSRSKTTKVLAVEPFAASADAMFARSDYRAWIDSGRLTLLIGPDYVGAVDARKTLTLKDETQIPPFIVATGLEERFAAETFRAKRLAMQVIAGAQKTALARKLFAGQYVLNTLTNIPVIAEEGDVANLAGAWTGMPAVVVGAGPSLDRNINELRNADGRVLVIAVDTAVRPLLAAGIRPHLVVAIDPSEARAQRLRNLPDTNGMWLVAEGSLDPSVFGRFARRTFTFKVSPHQPWPWLAGCGAGRGQLEAWGSVLTTAFDLARLAGCDPIVFLGADLAYTNDAQYCQHTVHDEPGKRLATPDARRAAFKAWVKDQPHSTEQGAGGAPVLTAPRFVQCRDWIAAQSLKARRVVNGTGAGILLGSGIAQASLSSLSLPPIEGGHASIQARLMSAWNQGRDARPAVMATLLRALEPGAALPKETWLEFGGAATTAGQVDESVASAAASLHVLERKALYLAMRRSLYDRRALTLEGARKASHDHFSQALLTVPALQAHVLLDFVQRTYEIEQHDAVRDILRTASRFPGTIRALDFGCGVGRTMKPLIAAGLRVDGVDISDGMLGFARLHPAFGGCQFFLGQGNDCGAAPEGAYDLVYSHVCFRDICSRTVRNEVLHAMARALRPGGVVLIEMPFHPDRQASTVPAPHVPWGGDCLDTTAADEKAEVWPTPDQLHLIHADFTRHFRDVRFQFLDMPTEGGPQGRLIVSGATAAGLAARVYASSSEPERT